MLVALFTRCVGVLAALSCADTQRYHAPPTNLLDFDVTDILRGSYRQIESTETELRFDPYRSSGRFDDEESYMEDGDSRFARSTGSSRAPPWEPPQRRGSLLDWEATDALERSVAPRGSVVLEQAGLGGTGGKLTFSSKTTTNAVAEVIARGGAGERGRPLERARPRRLVADHNNGGEGEPDTGRRSTSPLSPGTARPADVRALEAMRSRRHASSGSDWLGDLQRTMGLLQGKDKAELEESIGSKAGKSMSTSFGVEWHGGTNRHPRAANTVDTPSISGATRRRAAEDQLDNSDLPSWQRVMLAKQRAADSSVGDGSFATTAGSNFAASSRQPWRPQQQNAFRQRAALEDPATPSGYGARGHAEDGSPVLSLNESAYAVAMDSSPEGGSLYFAPTRGEVAEAETKAVTKAAPGRVGRRLSGGSKDLAAAPREWESPRSRASRLLQEKATRAAVSEAVLNAALDVHSPKTLERREFSALASETRGLISRLQTNDPRTAVEAHAALRRLLDDNASGATEPMTERDVLELESKLAFSEEEPPIAFLSKVRRIAAEERGGGLGGDYRRPNKQSPTSKGVTALQALQRRKLAANELVDVVLEATASPKRTAALARLGGSSALSPRRSPPRDLARLSGSGGGSGGGTVRTAASMSMEEAATVLQCMYRKVVAERNVLDRLLNRLGDDGGGGKSEAVLLEGQNWSALILSHAGPQDAKVPRQLHAQIADSHQRYLAAHAAPTPAKPTPRKDLFPASAAKNPLSPTLATLSEQRAVSSGAAYPFQALPAQAQAQAAAAVREAAEAREAAAAARAAKAKEDAAAKAAADEKARIMATSRVAEQAARLREQERAAAERKANQKKQNDERIARIQNEAKAASAAAAKARAEAGAAEALAARRERQAEPLRQRSGHSPVRSPSPTPRKPSPVPKRPPSPARKGWGELAAATAAQEQAQDQGAKVNGKEGAKEGRVEAPRFGSPLHPMSPGREASRGVASRGVAPGPRFASPTEGRFRPGAGLVKAEAPAAAPSPLYVAPLSPAPKAAGGEAITVASAKKPRMDGTLDLDESMDMLEAEDAIERASNDRAGSAARDVEATVSKALAVAEAAAETAAEAVEGASYQQQFESRGTNSAGESYEVDMDDDDEEEEGEKEGGESAAGAGMSDPRSSLTRGDSVASMTIPEDVEVAPPMSPYEVARARKGTLAAPLEVGVFAKALFDDEQHWYPCMVMARAEELLSKDDDDDDDEPRYRYSYTLEYFDGDTKTDVPMEHVVVMPREEATAHMKALQEAAKEEEAEGGDSGGDSGSSSPRLTPEVSADTILTTSLDGYAVAAAPEATDLEDDPMLSAGSQLLKSRHNQSSPMKSPQQTEPAAGTKSARVRPERPLPPGWVSVPAGSNTYYWHEASGEVVHERPEAPDAADEADDAVAESPLPSEPSSPLPAAVGVGVKVTGTASDAARLKAKLAALDESPTTPAKRPAAAAPDDERRGLTLEALSARKGTYNAERDAREAKAKLEEASAVAAAAAAEAEARERSEAKRSAEAAEAAEAEARRAARAAEHAAMAERIKKASEASEASAGGGAGGEGAQRVAPAGGIQGAQGRRGRGSRGAGGGVVETPRGAHARAAPRHQGGGRGQGAGGGRGRGEGCRRDGVGEQGGGGSGGGSDGGSDGGPTSAEEG